MKRYFELQPGDTFRTGSVEVKGGTVHRQFYKSESGAYEFPVPEDHVIMPLVTFHDLTPVWMI